MNRERAKELLPIIEAFADGETIQRYVLSREWEDVTTGAPFDDDVDYRIKPKPREFWINPDADDSDAIIYEAFNPDQDDFVHVREVIE